MTPQKMEQISFSTTFREKNMFKQNPSPHKATISWGKTHNWRMDDLSNVEKKQKTYDISLYWLVDRDSYNNLIQIPKNNSV